MKEKEVYAIGELNIIVEYRDSLDGMVNPVVGIVDHNTVQWINIDEISELANLFLDIIQESDYKTQERKRQVNKEIKDYTGER